MTTAAEILKANHPLHVLFLRWLGKQEATKRKAREFLRAFPQFKQATPA
jgi:hypothetical protein